MRAVAIIPARYGSTRLPGKPLADICGKPLIQHVYEKASLTTLDEVIIATDDQRIVDVVKSFGGKVEMTNPSCASGTDRLRELSDHLSADIYVNIQGDEPLLRPEAIDNLVNALTQKMQSDTRPMAATLCYSIDAETAQNPNLVKIVCDTQGNALYFSRSRIPYDRDGQEEVSYLGHIGVYAYTAEALKVFGNLPQSPLEQIEKLEQLRLLQAGIPIHCIQTQTFGPGVDTPEDLECVRRIIAGESTVPTNHMNVEDKLSAIRCVITDVDGVLTDGGLYYSSEGETLKRFNVKDGLAFSLAKSANIEIGILSGRDCPALRSRLKDLGIEHCRLGKLNKQKVLDDLLKEIGVTPQETAFVGDDLPDLECFSVCALGVTVADALPEIKKKADIVLKTNGGHGAFREFIDMLRRKR